MFWIVSDPTPARVDARPNAPASHSGSAWLVPPLATNASTPMLDAANAVETATRRVFRRLGIMFKDASLFGRYRPAGAKPKPSPGSHWHYREGVWRHHHRSLNSTRPPGEWSSSSPRGGPRRVTTPAAAARSPRASPNGTAKRTGPAGVLGERATTVFTGSVAGGASVVATTGAAVVVVVPFAPEAAGAGGADELKGVVAAGATVVAAVVTGWLVVVRVVVVLVVVVLVVVVVVGDGGLRTVAAACVASEARPEGRLTYPGGSEPGTNPGAWPAPAAYLMKDA